jgi:hypothetical protein
MLRPLRPLGFDLHRVRGVFSQGPFYYPPPSYEHRLVRKHRASVERSLEVIALVYGVMKPGGHAVGVARKGEASDVTAWILTGVGGNGYWKAPFGVHLGN